MDFKADAGKRVIGEILSTTNGGEGYRSYKESKRGERIWGIDKSALMASIL